MHSPPSATASNVSIHNVNKGVQFVIDLRQALSNFSQVPLGSAHVAAQRDAGSGKLSHDTIILSHKTAILSESSLKTIQPLFCLSKALLSLAKALVGL